MKIFSDPDPLKKRDSGGDTPNAVYTNDYIPGAYVSSILGVEPPKKKA